MSHPQIRSEPEGLLTLRLSKILSDPLRMRIVAECGVQETSPRGFRDEFGGPSLADTLRTFEDLVRFGWLEWVPAKASGKPQGEFDRLYRRAEPIVFEGPALSAIPDATKALVIWRVFEGLVARVKDALKAGTISKRDDSHLTWTVLALDRQGWDTVMSRVDTLFRSLPDEQEKANARMAESGEESTQMTTALLAFESPKRAR